MVKSETDKKEWLELAEAAELLGVHFSTLRRWADAGKIPHARTVSGRRRFRRAVLEALMQSAEQNTALAVLSPAEQQALESTRQSARSLAHQQGSWMEALNPEQRVAFRSSGQRMLALLMQVTGHQDAEPFLAEGRRMAQGYGEMCFQAGMTGTEMVQAFLFFRRTILESILKTFPLINARDPEGLKLLTQTNDFFDMVLVNAIDRYSTLDHQRIDVTSRS